MSWEDKLIKVYEQALVDLRWTLFYSSAYKYCVEMYLHHGLCYALYNPALNLLLERERLWELITKYTSSVTLNDYLASTPADCRTVRQVRQTLRTRLEHLHKLKNFKHDTNTR